MQRSDDGSPTNNSTIMTATVPDLNQTPQLALPPPSSLNDGCIIIPRSVAMRQALENPVTKWCQVPECYRNDPDFCVEFIKRAPVLPPKAQLERLMPQELRMSKAVTLSFLARSDFIPLYADRQLYCPNHLSNDTDVILQYVQKIPRALQMAHVDLCDDPHIVLAAVQRDGMEIMYASCRLQGMEDSDTATTLARSRFCPDDDSQWGWGSDAIRRRPHPPSR
jgi:hypothetical protein